MDMKLSALKGIGQKREQLLNEQGLHTPFDLTLRFPVRYVHRRLVQPSEIQDSGVFYVEAEVATEPKVYFIRKNLTRLSFKALAGGKSYSVSVFNQHYLRRVLFKGVRVVLYGKFEAAKSAITAQKVFLREKFEEGILPVYNVEGVSDTQFSDFVQEALAQTGDVSELVPEDLRKKRNLIDKQSLRQKAHRPNDETDLQAVKRRLKYEELLIYQLKSQLVKRMHQDAHGSKKTVDKETLQKFIESLPFSLSSSQEKAVAEIVSDIESDKAMQRMLQGDTGSGKTVVALIAAIAALSAKKQVVFMAPTEILARQHQKTLNDYLSSTPFEAKLFIQSMDSSDKKALEKNLRTGKVKFVVGTHILFSERIRYRDLGLVITDEQHRFGVEQRQQLKNKGEKADVLYLSATPIPRTLAMTLFGDMDVTTIDSPHGQSRVTTAVASFEKESEVLRLLKEAVERDEQAYLVAPRIEESEALHSVKSLYKKYAKRFPGRIALLHGKQSVEEKEETLEAFYQGECSILVATSVVEVGVHVENATLMVVYHAERFGYAQLHQLRGRIGRNGREGRCLLLYEGDHEIRKRLEVMKETNDGFDLSEYDLAHRGFGDLIGTLQSGEAPLQYVDLREDMDLLKTAREDAQALIDRRGKTTDSTVISLFESVENALVKDKTFSQ